MQLITAGTFLKAVMHAGQAQSVGGRVDENSSDTLSDGLARHLKLGRFKTGTPPRLDKHTIDYSKMLIQPGDDEWLHFSFRTAYHRRYQDQLPCYRTETNHKTHQIILNNLGYPWNWSSLSENINIPWNFILNSNNLVK